MNDYEHTDECNGPGCPNLIGDPGEHIKGGHCSTACHRAEGRTAILKRLGQQQWPT